MAFSRKYGDQCLVNDRNITIYQGAQKIENRIFIFTICNKKLVVIFTLFIVYTRPLYIISDLLVSYLDLTLNDFEQTFHVVTAYLGFRNIVTYLRLQRVTLISVLDRFANVVLL